MEFFKSAWHLWLAAPFAIVLFPLFPFVYARFKAAEWRWWLSGIRIGDVRLDSDLPRNALQGMYWKVIGWYLVASIVLTIYGVWALSPATSIPLLLLTMIVYFVLILSLNVVIRVYLLRDLWVRVLQSVRVENIAAAADVAAKGDLASALGEGFADGLDVAGL